MTTLDDPTPDLDEALETGTDLSDLVARYRIGGDSEATWAMRKAHEAKARLTEVERIAAAEIERIQAWAEREAKRPAQTLGFFTGLLEDYALRVRHADGRKSVSTPYGTVKTRTVQVGWSIDDEAFLAWAKDNRPELVKTTEAPRLADAKKALKADETALIVVDPETGEPVPGVTLTPVSVSATVAVES